MATLLQVEAYAIRAQVTVHRRGLIKVEQYGQGTGKQMAKVTKYHSEAGNVNFLCIMQRRMVKKLCTITCSVL